MFVNMLVKALIMLALIWIFHCVLPNVIYPIQWIRQRVRKKRNEKWLW